MRTPSQVFLIRHAEKPDAPGLHLSATGQARAKRLPDLIARLISERPLLHAIFAAANSRKSWRPVETVQPLAAALGVVVDTTFHDDDGKGLAKLLQKKAYTNARILISWRHENLPSLALALGAIDCPRIWPMEMYDRVWRLTYDQSGAATFTDLPQCLMPGDAPA